ncbi:MAG: complex I NDUFA9 subunit family protein [Betaproteobacteria bacterium]
MRSAAQRIVVLGGSGFVGRHLVSRLSAAGHGVVVPTRRREAAKHLILLPTVEVFEADIFDPKTLAGLLAGATAVVNLVGILNETGRNSFSRTHVELAKTMTMSCAAAGVRRLVQMSALHADPAGPSQYLRTKGEAEAIIRASQLKWTVFRPSVIFGPEDAFLNLFARITKLLPVVALAAPDARFQPIYVEDVVHCMACALDDELTQCQSYDLCGPRMYTLRELVRYVGELSGAVRPIIPLGPRLSRLQAAVLERLPGSLLSRDNLASMTKDSVCGCAFPPVFGIAPSAMEAVAPEFIAPGAMRSDYDIYRAGSGR